MPISFETADLALIWSSLSRSEEEEVQETEAAAGKTGTEKKGYVGIHATGFKELMLKPELLQAIADCGFEHPSEGEDLACTSGRQNEIRASPTPLTLAQSNTNVSHTPFLAWMSSARRNQAWERRLCSSSRSFSNSIPSLVKSQRSSYAIRESSPSRCVLLDLSNLLDWKHLIPPLLSDLPRV